MSINELEMKCQELRELQRLIEEAQAEAETIKDAIKAHMGDSETAYAEEYKITWKPVTTVRIDTTALKKAMPHLLALSVQIVCSWLILERMGIAHRTPSIRTPTRI